MVNNIPTSEFQKLREMIDEAKPSSELMKEIDKIAQNPHNFDPKFDPNLLRPKIERTPNVKGKVIMKEDLPDPLTYMEDWEKPKGYIQKKVTNLYRDAFSEQNRAKLEKIRSMISARNNNQRVLFGDELSPSNPNYQGAPDTSLSGFVELTENQQMYRKAKAIVYTGLFGKVAVEEFARSSSYNLYNISISARPIDITTVLAGGVISYFAGSFILNNVPAKPVRLVGIVLKYIGGVPYYLPGTVMDHLVIGPLERVFLKLDLPLNVTAEHGLGEFKSTGKLGSRMKKVFDAFFSLADEKNN